MAEDKGRQLWVEDVARLLGVEPSTVRFSASKTKRTPRAQRTACDLPLPAGKRKRQGTSATGHKWTTISSWWWEADILACRQARAEAGVLDLPRGPGGQFLSAAEEQQAVAG